MATVAEILAAADNLEKQGDALGAKKLRDFVAGQAKPTYSADQIRTRAEEYKAAGDMASHDKLMASIPAAPPATDAPYVEPAGDPARPPRADAPGFAPSPPRPDTFTDTAGRMVAGPMAAASAFAGGLTGGASPSREFLANDPLTKGLPSWMLTGLGGVGDMGGAAMSTLGAGITGAAGLATELIPGMSQASEQKFAEDVVGMSMFAVPQLAGVGSLGRASMAIPKVAPKVARAVESTPKIAIPETIAAIPETIIQQTPEQIATLVKKASSGGMGSVKAQEALAKAAKLNPEAKAAADRLGIELPADVFSDNEMVKAAAGLTRSEVGKEPEALWRNAVKTARDKADEIMAALDGSADIASLSEKVKGSLQATQAGLKAAAGKLYDEVDVAVPKSSPVAPQNIVKALNEVIEEIGGTSGMTPAERALFNLVTDEKQPVTYGRILREKALVGKAIARGESPYSSMDDRSLKRLYGALAEDQLAAVASLGDDTLRAKLRDANQLTAKQKGLEKRIVAAYGNDLDGSIGQKLKSAVQSAAKGDIAGLARILKVIPEDLRREAVSTALAAATRSARATEPGFGLPEFGKMFTGIQTNKPVYALLAKQVGPEAMGMLNDLATVAKRIVSADSNVLRTGKANQVLVGALQAEGIIGRVLHSTGGQRVVQSGGAALGAVMGGPVGAMLAAPISVAMTVGRPDVLLKAGKLFSSPEFLAMAESASAPAVAAVAKSKTFADWAKSARIPNPSEWFNSALKDVAPVGGNAAAQSANTDAAPYMALEGRY